MSENWKSFKGVKLPPKVRWFTITNHDLDFDYSKMDMNVIRWLAVAPETGSKTKKKHFQGFFYTRDQRSWGVRALKNLGAIFNGAHIEPMISKIANNEWYCSKENELTHYGVMPKQGARDDIKETVDEITEGHITPNDICVENPGFYHQYGRTLEKAFDIAMSKKFRTWMTTCTWWTGPSNSGKSHKAFENFHPDTHCILEFDDGGFWQNYKGQETVILNEFRGEIRFTKLLALIDKWPMYVKRKGKDPFPFLAKHIHITSVKSPEEVFKKSLDKVEAKNWLQWERRVKVVELKERETAQKCSEGNTNASEHKQKDENEPEIIQNTSQEVPHVVPSPSYCANAEPPAGVLHPDKRQVSLHQPQVEVRETNSKGGGGWVDFT